MPRVVPVPPGSLGIDTSAKLNAERCKAIAAAGVKFVIRTLPLPNNRPTFDLDAAETDIILGAGLGLLAYQHPLMPGWTASTEKGVEKGQHAVACAQAALLLPGTSIVYDAEETASGIDDACAEMTAFYANVKGGGYHCPVYQGAGMPLSGEDWYRRVPFEAYWKSLSNVPAPSVRSWCCFQAYPQQQLAGINVDFNMAQNDYLGGCLRMMVA